MEVHVSRRVEDLLALARVRWVRVLHIDLLLADVDLLALTDSIQTSDLGAMKLLLDISSFI